MRSAPIADDGTGTFRPHPTSFSLVRQSPATLACAEPTRLRKYVHLTLPASVWQSPTLEIRGRRRIGRGGSAAAARQTLSDHCPEGRV